jgi:hypothetical protein
LHDRGITHVALMEAPEHVVEDALTHGAGGKDHVSDLQFREDR